MRDAGLTLIELMITIAIIGILLSIGTMQFNRYATKSQVESQVNSLYADLQRARTEALYQKRNRYVRVQSTTFSVHSSALSAASGASALFTHAYKHQFASNLGIPATFMFDTHGLLSGTNNSICVEPGNNTGYIDSLIVYTTRIQMGKNNGTTCAEANITVK